MNDSQLLAHSRLGVTEAKNHKIFQNIFCLFKRNLVFLPVYLEMA